jgi:hypothetical protein
MIPSDLVLVLEETVLGSSRMVRNVEGRELAVVKCFIFEVAVKTGHHDIHAIGLVWFSSSRFTAGNFAVRCDVCDLKHHHMRHNVRH